MTLNFKKGEDYMNVKQFINGLLYFNRGKYNNIDNFMSCLEKYIVNKEVLTKQELLNELSKIMSAIENVKSDKINNEQAQNILIYNEIDYLYKHIENITIQFDFQNDFDNFIFEIKKVLNNINIIVDEDSTRSFIVDKFPQPYENQSFVALAPDNSDFKKYGIIPGVYFKKDSMSYIQYKLIFGHEVIHRIISRKGSELLARGLEEGICELIGTIYCGIKLIDKEYIINYFLAKRLNYNNSLQKFRLYTDYFRVACLLYFRYGINGISYIINSGREFIKLVEECTSKNDFQSLDEFFKEPPQYDEQLTEVLQYLSLGYVENEVVSPLAYYIIQHYDGTDNKIQFLNNFSIDIEDGKEALTEINKKIYGITLDANTILCSDLKHIKQNAYLRYEV